MERLTLSRRPKTGDKVECLPAGDGLPIWTTIPLDAKLPMMQNPKGSVILYTTKLGQPKHRCKQEYDFDLRDPHGKYICNEYHPLHDPHLKSYFSKEVMRRHLIKKGFISEDGKVLCSLREFNQYRQYLRHIFFLEIAKDRKGELENRGKSLSDEKADFQRKPSRGTMVRRRIQQQRERDKNNLKKNLSLKTQKLEKRLQAIREEMIVREHKQREEAERRQLVVFKNQQETEQRNMMTIKRWRQKERLHRRLIADREAQKKIQAEMKCLEKWNERKMSQKERLERQNQALRQEDESRIRSIAQREEMVNRKRQILEKKIEVLKERTRERKRKRDELYAKRFEEILASGDYRKWSRTREKRNKFSHAFNSSWDLRDVLNNLQVLDSKHETLGAVPTTLITDTGQEHVAGSDIGDDGALRRKAREIVDGVLERVKNEIYPAYLKSLGEDGLNYEATLSKSVRFSTTEDEMKPELTTPIKLEEEFDIGDDFDESRKFRPIAEHILTPCASQLEVQKLEAEAILGSPEIADKTSSVSFVETLLLRLLDDLNSGRLRKEDIMKLASYSMEIIQSTESENLKDTTIMEETEFEGPAVTSSSSSLIAKKLVDFTLGRILFDIKSGNVHHDDLASLTVSLVDISGGWEEGSISLSVSDSNIGDYVDETIKAATISAMDPREDSPVCEALLDNFMVDTLRRLITDLEEEALTKEQLQTLAKSIKDETKGFIQTPGVDLTDKRDIRLVLETLLSQLKTGDIDSQSLYQIIFAIVFSYSIIKSPPSPSYECKVTDLLKEVLNAADEKRSLEKLEIIDSHVMQEAKDKLSNTYLDINQIEKLTSSIMSLSTKPDVAGVESTSKIARCIVEDALLRAKEQILEEQADKSLIEGVQNIAEAVLLTVGPESQSPPLVDVFVEILEKLKQTVELSDQMEKDKQEELCDLINNIKSRSVHPDEVAEMARSVAEVVRSPPKSDQSVTAFCVVKDTLKTVRDDFSKGLVEQDIVHEMLDVIHFACQTVILCDPHSPALLNSLASFIRTILHLLSSKLHTGELNQADLKELSVVLKSSLEEKSLKSGQEEQKKEPTTKTKNEYTEIDNELSMLLCTDNVLDYLSRLIESIETGEMKADEVQDLAAKLIESGKALMASLSEKVSSISTDEAADRAVEEVLRTLQMEIESGNLTKDSLKEITKSIIISSSDSDFADELINGTIKSIERDVQQGYDVNKIPSVPTMDHSPSASTIASYIVIQTVDEIRRNISEKGIPREMIQSVASSLVTYLSGKTVEIGYLPVELQKHRNTIVNIVTCLRDDNIDTKEAEKIFCLILERYKDFLSVKDDKREATFIMTVDDASMIEDLVNTTLESIERSVTYGKLFKKEFSLPSAKRSGEASKTPGEVVEKCILNIKDALGEEETKTQKPQDIVDFIITIVEKLQAELSKGAISSLSMATFFESITSETNDLRGLEANALDNLSMILHDIETNRSRSIYINRILDTYLTTTHAAVGALSDPLKAVESILVSVSSDILTKFVKATLENIILDMRDGTGSRRLERESSLYVLRTASSVVAENVVKKVVDKVNDDLGSSLRDQDAAKMSKTKIETAASKLITLEDAIYSTLIKFNDSSSEWLASQSRHSSSITPKGIEDIVLETMHNIVSNLRLEQSIQPQSDKVPDEEKEASETSDAIHDFVLQTLQNIVTDLQDRRSQIDLGVYKTEKASADAMYELASTDSKQATTYVGEILHNVLHDMRSEMSTKSSESPADNQAVQLKSPLQLESSIIDTLIQALSGTVIQKKSTFLEEKQKDDVKKILLESIKKTIMHVNEGMFSQEEILSMYESLSKYLEHQTELTKEDENGSRLQNKVLQLLTSLLSKIEGMSVDNDMLNKLSSHLATVGMDTASDNTSMNDDAVSNESVASSEISVLVRNVITKMTQQLMAEHDKDKDTTDTEVKNNNADGKVTDKNFNRRNSASSSSKSTLNKDSDSSSTSLSAALPRRKTSATCKSENKDATAKKDNLASPGKKTEKRDKKFLESQRQQVEKHDDRLLKGRPIPRPHLQSINDSRLTAVVRGCTETSSNKVKKDTPIPANYRFSGKPKKLLHQRNYKKKEAFSFSSSSTPVRTTEFQTRLIHRLKLRSPDIRSLSPDALFPIPPNKPSPPQADAPFELKSLCGVHKTRIRYRNTRETQSDSTTDDGSYTSELF